MMVNTESIIDYCQRQISFAESKLENLRSWTPDEENAKTESYLYGQLNAYKQIIQNFVPKKSGTD